MKVYNFFELSLCVSRNIREALSAQGHKHIWSPKSILRRCLLPQNKSSEQNKGGPFDLKVHVLSVFFYGYFTARFRCLTSRYISNKYIYAVFIADFCIYISEKIVQGEEAPFKTNQTSFSVIPATTGYLWTQEPELFIYFFD